MPEVGNGHLATVVQGDTMFMNGLYNGKAGASHRARVPSPASYKMAAHRPEVMTRSYSLDLGRGEQFVYFDA